MPSSPRLPHPPALPRADGAYRITRHGVSLTNGASEPVQRPGGSLSHGVAVVLPVSDLAILPVGDHARDVFTLAAGEGANPLDLSLQTIDGLAALECEPTARAAAAARALTGLERVMMIHHFPL